ncbi:hypothetical protein Zm00014a_006195, partial [Zea mays]
HSPHPFPFPRTAHA